MQRVAEMLAAKAGMDAKPVTTKTNHFKLVSWCSEARSRREDELARSRAQQTPLVSIEP
jgi:hypothetical protein